MLTFSAKKFENPFSGSSRDQRENFVCEGFVTKRLVRPAAVVLLTVAIIFSAAAADSAKSFFVKGKEAEARQNYELAYDFYLSLIHI